MSELDTLDPLDSLDDEDQVVPGSSCPMRPHPLTSTPINREANTDSGYSSASGINITANSPGQFPEGERTVFNFELYRDSEIMETEGSGPGEMEGHSEGNSMEESETEEMPNSTATEALCSAIPIQPVRPTTSQFYLPPQLSQDECSMLGIPPWFQRTTTVMGGMSAQQYVNANFTPPRSPLYYMGAARGRGERPSRVARQQQGFNSPRPVGTVTPMPSSTGSSSYPQYLVLHSVNNGFRDRSNSDPSSPTYQQLIGREFRRIADEFNERHQQRRSLLPNLLLSPFRRNTTTRQSFPGTHAEGHGLLESILARCWPSNGTTGMVASRTEPTNLQLVEDDNEEPAEDDADVFDEVDG